MGQTLERRARLGNYEVMEELGVGAMATVYKARPAEGGRPVAIKVPDRRLLNNGRALRQFKHESQALIRLRHPNIVRVHSVGHQNDLPYIVMEYVDGHTLSQEIHHRGQFSLEEVVTLLAPIAAALDYSHGMETFHCDVKPGNIRLRRDRIPVLVDFGIVQTTDGTVWDEGKPVGSVWYMSPEQARGQRSMAQSDQYSLAVVAYEMLTGKVPFDGDNPYAIVLQQRDVQPPIPPSWSGPLKAVMQQALDKTPEGRFSSCLEFIAALDEASHGRMPGASSPETIRLAGGASRGVAVNTDRSRSPQGSWRPSAQSIARIAVALLLLISVVIIVSGIIKYAKHVVKHPTAIHNSNGSQLPSSGNMPAKSNREQATPVQGSSRGYPQAKREVKSSEAGSLSPSSPAGSSARPEVTPITRQGPGTERAEESVGASQEPIAKSVGPIFDNPKTKNSPTGSLQAQGPKKKTTQPQPGSQEAGNAGNADGFTRADIPDLLRKAERDAGRGDYRSARYEYGLVLRLDHRNPVAREGLRHVQEAEKENSN